jgi:hypothetical protein
MQVFRLDPVAERLDDPRWETSTIKEPFWIKANSEDHARAQAAQILMRMADMRPGHPILFSPWPDHRLADCAADNPPIDVPDGIIVTISGHTHS